MCVIFYKTFPAFPSSELTRNRELQQQQRRRLRKRHFKKIALLQTLSCQLVQFVKCWQIFLELKSKRLSKFKKRKRKSLSCVHVLDKTWNEALSRCSRAATAKKCSKKGDERAKLLFFQSKPITFLPFSLASPSSLLKLPVNETRSRLRWKFSFKSLHPVSPNIESVSLFTGMRKRSI